MKSLYDNQNEKYVSVKDIINVDNKVYTVEAINYVSESVTVREGIRLNNPTYAIKPEYIGCYFVFR